MPALNFPASSSSPWTAPNGVIYTWNADGYWEAKADPNDFDTDYLKLNATNDPVTGNLALDQDLDVGDNLAVTGTSAFTGNVSAAANLAVTGTSAFTGLTTHEDGVKVTGGSDVSDVTDGGCIYQAGSELKIVPSSTGAVVRCNVEGSNSHHALRTALPPSTGKVTNIGIRCDNAVTQTNSDSVTSAFYSTTSAATGGKEFHGYKFIGSSNLTSSDVNAGFYSAVAIGDNSAPRYNFYAAEDAPSYFAGDIDCDGLINGAFSLRMQTDDPAAFQTTYATDEEGNQVENQTYVGTTEDLLSIIKDLRTRVAALEAQLNP